MSSAVAELEEALKAMGNLKPPGVSGSRIQSITALCNANVQSESVLIQKLYTYFKKAQPTHKLGVLYVVDSVTRKWLEQAKSAGQPINSAAPDGTFAAGVHRVKELLPVLMNDIIQSSPDDQKEKIRKLVDIWEKGQTFPLQILTTFKDKLDALNRSTTPEGSPPADLQQTLGLQPIPSSNPPPAVPNTSSILEALANMARQNNAIPPANATPPKDSHYNVSSSQSNPVQQVAAYNQGLPFPPIPPPVNVPAPAATFASQGTSNGVQNFASNQTNPFAGNPPIVPSAVLDPAVQQQLMLIKALTDQGIPLDRIPSLLPSLIALGAQGAALQPVLPPPQFAAQQQSPNGQSGWGQKPEESRDRNGNGNGYHDAVRSPPDRFRRHSRSRSPPPAWNARDSQARRRDEPNYNFDRGSPGRSRGDDRGRGRGGNDYRQRSPPRRPSPPRSNGAGDKWIGHDETIPKGSIKVLSRTLFVGGVTSTEQELRSIFSRFGKVQTCIVNKDKRHAFVKMCTRADAVLARDEMEKNRTPDSALRTRWGVGFGPRDCSDYQTGVSVIPIGKLTDADRKWMLTAEYGGSGGKPIESGMVVEEPDIEIGQGVSSKAISRRMQTDKGGNNGPKSSRDRDGEDGPRFRRGDRDGRRDDGHKDGPPSMPPVPAFGGIQNPFPFPFPNGMPMMPPGFPFTGQNQSQSQQPPAPGHRT